jgi:6-pyruvoyltetrahydropterin/6-carboxytetrahydropterin synthase
MDRIRRCTRRLTFDAAHRVMRHESKCRNLHGHRYVLDVTCQGELDGLGRVVDFGLMKERIGGWVDERLDHGTILHEDDTDLIKLCQKSGWKIYVLGQNPTAENLAQHLFASAGALLPADVRPVAVRLYETPNCWADYP